MYNCICANDATNDATKKDAMKKDATKKSAMLRNAMRAHCGVHLCPQDAIFDQVMKVLMVIDDANEGWCP